MASTTAAKSPPTPVSKGQVEKNKGFFVNAADWLLSRLPWFQHRYEQWSHAKRVIVALLLYVIILPVIPIILAIVLYIRDPEGFKNSKTMYILGAIIVAQLSAFGLIAAQPPVVTSPDTTNITSDAENSIRDKQVSEPTNGRQFENCDAAFKAGVFNISSTDPSYAKHLDGDGDGVGCEKKSSKKLF